jgi:hypothetical protein
MIMEIAMANKFKRGEFKPYTAVTKVHLGSIEADLLEGETVLFDGTVMKRGNEEHDISVLTAAIKVGWLVPEGEDGSYEPQPADVQVHDAKGADRTRVLQVEIQDEERGIGTIAEVRAEGSPPVHVANDAGRLSQGAPTGASEYNDDEGRVVGRMKAPAKSSPIKLDGTDRKIVAELDNSGRTIVDPVASPKRAIATGDVEEAIASDNLVDLLPDAASTTIPKPGTSGEGRGDESDSRARAYVGSTTVGTAEDGDVIAVIGDGNTTEVTATEVSKDAIREAKLEVVRQFVPGFEWDLTIPWNRRAKMAVERYGSNLPVINAILSIETDAVRRGILERLYKD